MTLLEQIQKVADKHNYDSRKYRYKIISEITDTPEDICEKIVSLDRNMCWAFPVDEVGAQKESEYHRSPALWELENRSTKLQNDILKFS
jgi:hypothetical protein